MKKFLLFVAALFGLLGTVHAEDLPLTKLDRMTPLVGSSCVINQIDKDLIDVFGSESSLGYLVDTNVNNYVSLSGLAGIEVAYHQIVSVKDMENYYGEPDSNKEMRLETGFVLQSSSDGTNLLTADVLKMFVIETYLDSVKQESSVYEDEQSGLLDLNLITVSGDGKTRVSIKATKPFNEVRLAVAGVNVEAFTNLKLYYAYVGSNEEQPITKTHFYPNASVKSHAVAGIGDEWTTSIWNWDSQKEKLVGANSESDGVGFGILSSLLTEPRVTIDAGKEIPANTEVGFVIESGSVLAVNLLENTILSTYDANGNELESKTIVSVLGLSALSGGKTTVSMVATKPFQMVKIQFGGLNIDVGGTKIYYAYTRDANVYPKEECDLKLSADMAVCSQNSYQLDGVDGITWSIESQPEGANATVSSTGLVENMTVAGEYVIKATKGDCVDHVIINNSPSAAISYECNRPIVGAGVKPYAPAGGGCLLCLSPELDNGALNVVDEDLTNYIEYTKGLDLLSNTSIYGVESETVFTASEESPRRVGFVMQATDQFLTADLLKFFVIKTYMDGTLVESSPVDENDAVAANLIGGKDNQMRFSFVATKPFNQVTIWTAGILSLNLSKYRIYYAFEEPATSSCFDQYSATACLTMLSAQQHGATISYERTGFGGVANVGATMRNLANVIDGDLNTSAYIGKVAGIAANTSLSVKTNRVFENGYQAGFVVKEQTFVGNVDLLRGLRIRTYLNGVATGDESIVPEVLSLDLIGGAGKSLVTITPTMPFDEIQLDMGGLVDALVELDVYGAFVQSDTDGDGIPDCLDKRPCGTQLVVTSAIVPCGATQADIVISGYDPDATYTLFDGENEYPFVDGVASFNINPGYYNCTIRENNVDLYENLIIEVHPDYTEWTGAVSSDWTDWDNWSHGVPGECTNVLIPSPDSLLVANNVVRYPVLEEGGGIYVCNNIYLKPEAELIRQDLLTYNKAWVALNVVPEINNMVSSPLQETVSGDFFTYKTSGDAENLVQNHKNPLNGDALVGDVNRLIPLMTLSTWSNSQWNQQRGVLDHQLSLGEGFVILPEENQYVNEDDKLEVIYGKEDSVYNRVTPAGGILPIMTNIERDKANVGRFTYTSDTTITISGAEGQSIYVIGNPFVCSLNVDSFLNENSSIIESIRINNDVEANPSADYELSSNVSTGVIAPSKSFFVKTILPTEELTITFTKGMMAHGVYDTSEQAAPQTRAASSTGEGINLANIKAYAQNGEAVISASEAIQTVQVVTANGQMVAAEQPNATNCRVALASGVNIVKVQTENGEKVFKLVNKQ